MDWSTIKGNVRINLLTLGGWSILTMDEFERKTLEGLAALQTSQQVTNAQLSFVKEKVEKIENKLARQEKKDEEIKEKLLSLENETKCLPEIKEKVSKLDTNEKRNNKYWISSIGILALLSFISLGMSQSIAFKSCTVEELNSSGRAEIQTKLSPPR